MSKNFEDTFKLETDKGVRFAWGRLSVFQEDFNRSGLHACARKELQRREAAHRKTTSRVEKYLQKWFASRSSELGFPMKVKGQRRSY